MALVTTATTLLHLMTLLAPDPIPVALFMDDEPIREALAELEGQGLISVQGMTATVPPNVRKAMQSRITPERLRDELTLLLRSVNRISPAKPSDPRSWELWDLLRPHAAELLRRTGELPLTDTASVALLAGQLAAFLWAKGLPGEAEPLMRRALAVDQACFGSDHPSVARDLNNLAQMLQDAGRPHEAEPLMRHAVEIFVRALGPDHPSTRGVRKNLELLFEELGYRHNW